MYMPINNSGWVQSTNIWSYIVCLKERMIASVCVSIFSLVDQNYEIDSSALVIQKIGTKISVPHMFDSLTEKKVCIYLTMFVDY